MRWRMLLRWGACVGVCVAMELPRSAGAQGPVRSALDERSVLVAWTNDPVPGATVDVAAAASAAAQAREAEIDQAVEDAYKLARGGRMQQAVAAFNAVLQKAPANAKARFGLGTMYIQMEQYTNALGVMEPMMLESPKDYSLKNNVAWLYATAKDSSIRNGKKAVALAQEALVLAPRDFHVWSTLAEGYYVLGQYDRAFRNAEEALRLAQLAGADRPTLADYERQLQKSKRAAEAMSLME